MILDWPSVQGIAERHGRSFFVLDAMLFRKNFETFLNAFQTHYPAVQIGYSYKTNYTPQLCKIIYDLGGYAEVVSSMEYSLAKRIGNPGSRIVYNGPYKGSDTFKEAALTGVTLNLDSVRDVDMLCAIAQSHPEANIAVVLRCNFALHTNEISRFGMDVDGIEFKTALERINTSPAILLKGLHCHFPDRDLDSFGRRARMMVELVNQIFPERLPEILNIGGGYFSHMPENMQNAFSTPTATFADYGRLIGETLSKGLAGRGPLPTLFLEPGTALVADTQVFYTQVISTKVVRGKNFATVSGSSFDISPVARSRNLPVTPILQANDPKHKTTFDVVGYTCIEHDILSEGVQAPLQTNDFLCYSNVGSYSVVMRPPFILPANPILLHDKNGLRLIKDRQTDEDVFRNYRFD